MSEHIFLAYFESVDDARDVMFELRRKGYITSLDKIESELPDPDLSVSALMVGFLPDLAHGIFRGGGVYDEGKKDGAYIMVVVDDQQSMNEVRTIIEEHGGHPLERIIEYDNSEMQ